MSSAVCGTCGATVPAFYLSGGLCDGCKWDTWIPEGYQQREAYAFDPAWRHPNATRRPPLGPTFLDERGDNVWDIMQVARVKVRQVQYGG